MPRDNRSLFDEAFTQLQDGLVPVLEISLGRKYGSSWRIQYEQIRKRYAQDIANKYKRPIRYEPLEIENGVVQWDPRYVVEALDLCWPLFQRAFAHKERTAKTPVLTLRDAGVKWAHPNAKNRRWFENDRNAHDALWAIVDILQALHVEAQAKATEKLAQEFDESRVRGRAVAELDEAHTAPAPNHDLKGTLSGKSQQASFPPLPEQIARPDRDTAELLSLATSSTPLRLGPAIDGCIEIVHSYQYKGWSEGDVQFESEEEPRHLSQEIAQFLADNPLPPHTENRPKYTLTGLIPDSSELANLKLRASPTSYARTAPLQRHLRNRVLLNSSGQNETILERYAGRLLQFEDCELPSIIASQITVPLEDGEKLLLTQRTRHRGNDWYRGKWCCSIEEQMNGPPLPDTTPDPDRKVDQNLFDTVVRGIQEELFDDDYLVPRDRIKLLSFIVEGLNLNVSSIALIALNMHIEEVKTRWQASRDGTSEILDFAEVPWSIEALAPVLFRRNLILPGLTIHPTEWHGATGMRILAGLYHKFGIAETHRELIRLRDKL